MATATGAVTAPQRRWRESALLDWLTTSDHKKIGLLYMASALFFFLVGGVEAMLLRIQLTRANLQIISPELYNQLFTMHGTTMIFLMAMPILAGFGNYFVPLMIGARDMAFPKINALGLLALPVRRHLHQPGLPLQSGAQRRLVQLRQSDRARLFPRPQ